MKFMKYVLEPNKLYRGDSKATIFGFDRRVRNGGLFLNTPGDKIGVKVNVVT